MATRLELHGLLVDMLGSSNVYFQPPESIKMEYPCIVYIRDNWDKQYADNETYRQQRRYQVTVMDRNPDSEIPDKVAALPLCSYDRFFAVDDLNHDVFNLFF